jgi:Lon protease-like protein
MFPLGTVLFPHALMPLHVFEPRYQELTQDCLAGDSRFGIVLIERGAEVGGGDQRTLVGTRALISRTAQMPDGRSFLLVQGEARIRIQQWLDDDPYPLAQVEEWSTPEEAVEASLVHQAKQIVRRTRGLLAESGATPALSANVQFDPDPEKASWQLCAEAPINSFDAQQLLSCQGVSERLERLIELTEAVERDLHRLLSGA